MPDQPEEFDTSCTDESVCPHCGHECDPTDLRFNAGGWTNMDCDMDCDKCGKPFRVEADYSFTYSTRVVEESNDA